MSGKSFHVLKLLPDIFSQETKSLCYKQLEEISYFSISLTVYKYSFLLILYTRFSVQYTKSV